MAFTEQEARDRLAMMVQPGLDPTLDSGEIDALVRIARRRDTDGNEPDDYGVWSAGTNYLVGTLVTPTARNGFVYRCSTAGVSGAAQPAWPTTLGATVADANPLVWTAYGRALWTPTWDLSRSAAEGWRTKAAKAAGRYSFSDGSSRYERNQVVENCLKMAKYFETGGGGAGSIPLVGPMADRLRRVPYWERVLA